MSNNFVELAEQALGLFNKGAKVVRIGGFMRGPAIEVDMEFIRSQFDYTEIKNLPHDEKVIAVLYQLMEMMNDKVDFNEAMVYQTLEI